ncbi:MAG: hypothetical protein AAF429_02260 [Pseudomonadota bacterium]
MPDFVKYGLVAFAVIFFVGWITGMGGSLLPNHFFSLLMGVFAGVLYLLAEKYFKRKKEK